MKTLFPWALSLLALSASAAPPANLAGSTWTVQVNRNIETLVINTQAGPGAPGNATCRALSGSLGIAPLRGWYCPATGRIHLQHRNLATGNTVRSFTGNVADQVAGGPNLMAGTAIVMNAAFGDLGEVNFSASE